MKKVASHAGSGLNQETITTILEHGEYTTIEISDRSPRNNTLTKVKFRNVGDLNPESAIQFEVTVYKRDINRTTYAGFSIPTPLVDLFLNNLQTVKKAKQQ